MRNRGLACRSTAGVAASRWSSWRSVAEEWEPSALRTRSGAFRWREVTRPVGS